jgi:hypothetical protein
VAVAIVDVLEAIEVQHHHGQRARIARRQRGLEDQALVEGAPVGQPGQGVGDGLDAELPREHGQRVVARGQRVVAAAESASRRCPA